VVDQKLDVEAKATNLTKSSMRREDFTNQSALNYAKSMQNSTISYDIMRQVCIYWPTESSSSDPNLTGGPKIRGTMTWNWQSCPLKGFE